ncbi:Nedd4-Like E3 Ubiquitin-Protein Ligase Wwp1 [Manis pentadactyla]|nr:Nedd4-Like E3 Ubiquitin-Protein Ligase Wwp1 [Manis pentadactyla]
MCRPMCGEDNVSTVLTLELKDPGFSQEILVKIMEYKFHSRDHSDLTSGGYWDFAVIQYLCNYHGVPRHSINRGIFADSSQGIMVNLNNGCHQDIASKQVSDKVDLNTMLGVPNMCYHVFYSSSEENTVNLTMVVNGILLVTRYPPKRDGCLFLGFDLTVLQVSRILTGIQSNSDGVLVFMLTFNDCTYPGSCEDIIMRLALM